MDQASLLQNIADKVRSGGVGGLTLALEVREVLTNIVNTIFSELADGVIINQQVLSGFVPIDGNAEIHNLKTFTVLPQSASLPQVDSDFVTKKYIDDLINAIEISDFVFDSDRYIKRQVAGLENINLGKATAKETLEELLYPVKTPSGSITGPPIHLYGQFTDAIISYELIRTDQPITSADVNGVDIHINSGESQEGTINVPHNPASDSVFMLTVTAGDKVFTTTFISKIVHPVYAGQTSKDNIVSLITNVDLNALAFFEKGDDIKITVDENKRLIIALPEDEVNPFLINGIFNNYFTIDTFAFTNYFGSTSNYIVYVSKSFATGDNLITFLNPKI